MKKAKHVDKRELLGRLEKISYDAGELSQVKDEGLSMDTSLLSMLEIDHNWEFRRVYDSSEHLSGKVYEPDDLDLEDID